MLIGRASGGGAGGQGGQGGPYAVARLLLFLVGTAACVALLALVTSAFLAAPLTGFWGLALPHGVIAVSALIAALAMLRWVDREEQPLDELGLPLSVGAALRGSLRGIAFGALLVASLVAVQLIPGWLKPMADEGTLAAWLRHMGAMAILFAIGGASEELLFRGYGFQRMVEWLGIRWAVVVDAALFGALHAINPKVSIIPLINIALAGALLAGAYLRTRSLWVAIGLHWSWNWFTTLFDLPVSGLEFDAPVYDFRELGPDLLTGGAFGPEGGLLATLVLVVAIAWIFRAPFPEARSA